MIDYHSNGMDLTQFLEEVFEVFRLVELVFAFELNHFRLVVAGGGGVGGSNVIIVKDVCVFKHPIASPYITLR